MIDLEAKVNELERDMHSLKQRLSALEGKPSSTIAREKLVILSDAMVSRLKTIEDTADAADKIATQLKGVLGSLKQAVEFAWNDLRDAP